MSMNRATFFFKDTNGYGWTETIHNNKSTLTDVLDEARSLLPLRVALLGNTANLVYIRVSDDVVFRDSQVYLVPSGDQSTRFSAAGGADPANTCLVTRLTADATHRRTLYLRGLPDACVTLSGKYTPTPDFQNAFLQWAASIIDGFWSLKSKTRLLVPVAISAAAQTVPSGLVLVTCVAPHGLTATNGVVITGVRGATQINGTWQVLNVPTPISFTIQLNVIMSTYVAGGSASPVGFILNPLTKVSAERISKRAAGRPFDSPHGRRRRVAAR